MADDIVTRLREHQNPWYPLDEAADEIDSLRSYIADLQAELCRLERELARHV